MVAGNSVKYEDRLARRMVVATGRAKEMSSGQTLDKSPLTLSHLTQVDIFVPRPSPISYACHPFHTACSSYGIEHINDFGNRRSRYVSQHPMFVSVR